MLLEEELEMWKEKENDSMDEGAQEDEQFEMEIDNGKTVRSESEDGEEDDDCWKCGSDPNRVEWVSGTLVQGQQAKDETRTMRNRQGIQKSSLVEEESDMKRNEFEVLALLRRRVKVIVGALVTWAIYTQGQLLL